MAAEQVEKLTRTNLIEKLESAADSGVLTVFELPSGRRIVIADENLETLQVALRDPLFVESLEQAIQDVKDGNVVPVEDDLSDEVPQKSQHRRTA